MNLYEETRSRYLYQLQKCPKDLRVDISTSLSSLEATVKMYKDNSKMLKRYMDLHRSYQMIIESVYLQ